MKPKTNLIRLGSVSSDTTGLEQQSVESKNRKYLGGHRNIAMKKTNIKNTTHLIRLGSLTKETRGLACYTTEAIFFRSMGKWWNR